MLRWLKCSCFRGLILYLVHISVLRAEVELFSIIHPLPLDSTCFGHLTFHYSRNCQNLMCEADFALSTVKQMWGGIGGHNKQEQCWVGR